MKKFFLCLLPFLVLNNIISAQSSPPQSPDSVISLNNDSVFIVKNKIFYSKYSNDSIMFFQNGIKISTKIIFFKSGITEPQLKRLLWKSGAIFISGLAEGTAETLKFHYGNFKNVFPGANDSIWDPRLSSSRKYKNGDPNQGPRFIGSTGPFVGVTDPYHGLHTIRNSTMMIGVTIPIGAEKSLKDYAIEMASSYLLYTAGFYMSYNVLFKNK